MIIGMQKCGTTDLYSAISKHEDADFPLESNGKLIKEIHFFDAYHYRKYAETQV